jgi:protein-tyrosine phosphatase
MGKSITNKEQQVVYMKQRLNIFLEVLDSIEPEHTDLEDIDRLIAMVDELENKMQQFQSRSDTEN